MTAYSNLDSAVSSFQWGAFEYLTKPFDVEKAVELIHRAVEQGIRNESGAKELTAWRQDATEIICQAPAMQEIFRAVGRRCDKNVRLTAPSINGFANPTGDRQPHPKIACRHQPAQSGLDARFEPLERRLVRDQKARTPIKLSAQRKYSKK